MGQSSSNKDYIDELKERIDDLKRQMPKHSIPPGMIMALEDLEDSLTQALRVFDSNGDALA
jgi:hypothetical protein